MGWAGRWVATACVLACMAMGMAGCKASNSSPAVHPPGDRHDEPPVSGGSDGGPPEPPDGGTWPNESGGPDGGTGDPDAGPLPDRDADAVRQENKRPGTTAWRLMHTANNREIEGYALETSVTQGDTLRVAVSLSDPKEFSWYVYRLGYYGGAGAREVARGSHVQGIRQPDCPVERATGVIACTWTPTLELPVKEDWVRGVYVVKLVREDTFQRYVPFVVRDANPRPEVALIIPTATWAAYNTWGGTSLYDDQNRVMKDLGVARAFQSSYDRPFARGQGSGHLMVDDISVVTWLESQGLDVGYFTDEDMDAGYDFLSGARVLMLSGHDEYWSSRQRDFADQALAEGRSLINLGANNGYWQVRMDAARDGRPRRIVTCFKGHDSDPFKDQRRTVKFRELPKPRPENGLFGVMFNSRWHQWSFPAVITAPNHWALAGTGLKTGDTLWMSSGYELDQRVDNGFEPEGVEVLSESPALSLQGAFGYSHMVVRQQGRAYVFSAGGIDFAQKLAGTPERQPDARAGRIVANVLFRAMGHTVPEALVQFQPPVTPSAAGPFAKEVRTVAGKPGRHGTALGRIAEDSLGAPVAVAVLPGGGWAVVDGLANAVKRISPEGEVTTLLGDLAGPLGIAVDAAGNIYVSDSDNSVIRRITPGGRGEVFAGTGAGLLDGPARSASFNQPAGLAFTPDGNTLLVADLNNGLIRRIDMTTSEHLVSTVGGDWLYRPSAVTAASDGTLYVVESGMSRVVRLRGGATTVMTGSVPGYQEGPASSAQLMPYLGIALLKDGSLAISDPGNYRVRRLLFNSEGAPDRLTTLAGTGRYGFGGGPGGDASLVLPAGLALGPDGTLYVADAGNALVRAITP
ncbi:hemolysin [Corallococcus sp. M34]|uniref:N,N-dimethylformamidase beta subunit family domain-containing protein n=1 Tax=Citreicoccus inhibens TaxID=2849499 RepID=UPI001C23B57E|nr:N,N-dimethylformamidase beta subunit family domain-containing protein [Citreicoccus inhibens]MBU8897648.1 hemolysin [Citreicoccus inhibens]